MKIDKTSISFSHEDKSKHDQINMAILCPRYAYGNFCKMSLPIVNFASVKGYPGTRKPRNNTALRGEGIPRNGHPET